MGYVDCQREGVEFIPIKKPKWNWKMKIIQRFWLFFGQYEKVYWNLPQIKEAEEKLKKYEFDIILAHNEETIPLVLKYKKNSNKTAKILNAEKEGEKILKILEEVLG